MQEMSKREIGMEPGDDLTGKVAIVTGAGRNIGRAIALALAAGGARVVVSAHTSALQAEETAEMIKASGAQAELILADVGDPDEVENLMSQVVTRCGQLDILVNNAAVRFETPLLEMSFEEWRSVFSVNLDAVFLCTKAALPHLIAAGSGAIVNLGGQTAHAVVAERAHVVSSKAAVAAFTKAVALEFADRNVTANCVVPGSIDTVRGLPGAPERPSTRRPPPIGRLGSVWEIASIVRMLAGPESRYITGQTIHVNGGGYMP
jgi:3-oxoacyl-[acyl-carrier protein] reductase